jgi:hypothetical protein
MKKQVGLSIALVAALVSIYLSPRAAAQYAVQVLSYNAGTTPAMSGGQAFDDSSAALGEPERFTGEGVFPGVVTPFNPPFLRNEIVSVGEGGQLTLRLSNYAVPQAAAPEIGVFAHPGLIDQDIINFSGVASDPVTEFSVKSALVDVSTDGVNWVSLSNQAIPFDIPSNGYTDLTSVSSSVPGTALSDFQQPFTRPLSDFGGLSYHNPGGSDILGLLAGSGGGKWLDISNTGLSQVGYIRFSVADDGDASTKLNFELDAVSVSHAALGTATVPEPSSIALAVAALVGSIKSVRRARRRR